jgi:hypothetical protein
MPAKEQREKRFEKRISRYIVPSKKDSRRIEPSHALLPDKIHLHRTIQNPLASTFSISRG